MARTPADWRYKQHVKRERRRLEREPDKAVCWLCGDPIDMALPVGHARAFTLDHIIPLARGGDLHGETKPAHRSCNSSRNKAEQLKQQTTIVEW